MGAALLQKLRADREDTKARGNAIAAEAEKAGGYSDAQLTELEELETKMAGFDRGIAAEMKRQEWELDAPGIPDTSSGSPDAGKPDPAKPFPNLVDFLSTVRSAAYAQKKGAAVDPRLHQVEAAAGPHGMNETVGAEGGFAVQKDLVNDLMTETWQQSNLLQRTREFPVGANSNGIKLLTVDETSRATGSRWGGVRVYWVAEAGVKTASKPKLKPLEMQLQKLAGMLVSSDELLQDDTQFSTFAKEAFSEEMAFVIDDSIVRGNGAGQMLGILNASALVTVAAEGGQAADTFVAENVWGMYSRLPARALARAEWFINSALIPQLATLQLAVGTGGVPLYIPPGGISQAPFGTLLGRPINYIEQASAPGDVGDVILADLGEYIHITKGGIKQDTSIHVYFDTDETAFRWVMRINGQPRWQSAITPYKGSATLSPFVTLAAR